MTDSIVVLTKCADYNQSNLSEALRRQFELSGGLEKFVSKGDSVLLKPNFISPRSRRYAVQTDPAIIIETARLLKDFGARPFVGDSPAWGSVFTCAKKLKLVEPLRKLNVPVKQLDRPKKCKIKGLSVSISSVAIEADVIINLPKFKSHQQIVATFAVKNMFGCVCGKQKALWHFRKGKKNEDFCQLLIGIYKFLNPALTIVDGIMVMDGPGPIHGRARPLGWIIGSTDPVACEAICSKLVNINPRGLPIIKAAKKLGFGCSNLEKITIAGDTIPQKPCQDFEPAPLIPLRFSFSHVCKSITKQIFIRLRTAIKKLLRH